MQYAVCSVQSVKEELVTEFYLALSALYRSLGGSGLRIRKDEIGAAVPEEAEP